MSTEQSKSPPENRRKEEAKTSITSISSLNAKLISHGFAKRPLDLSRLSDSQQAAVSNVIAELLGANVSNLSSLEDLNSRCRTLEYEASRERKQHDKVDRLNARLETEIQSLRAAADENAHRVSEEEEKVKALRNDLVKARKAIESVQVAAQQEATRSQIKLDKTLSQLARKTPLVPPGYELLNPVPAGHIAPVAPGPLPLLEQSLKDLADIRQNLQEETEAFRHIIVSTANGILEALAAGSGQSAPDRQTHADFFALDPPLSGPSRRVRQSASRTAHAAIADARLKALVSQVRAELTANVPTIMRDGSGETESQAADHEAEKRAQRGRERELADLRDRVKDLEVELAIGRAKEDEARKVVEEMARLNVGASVPSTTDFEDQRLRDELLRQKRLLDSEREQLQAEIVRLQEDRVAFDTERAAAAAAAIKAAEAEAEAAKAAEAAQVAAAFAAESEVLHAPDVPDALVPAPAAQPQPQPQGTPPKVKAARQLKHMPSSPSPLSPRRPPPRSHPHPHPFSHPSSHPPSPKRTPQKHTVGKRRGPRTPLARLVLERAHRARTSAGSAEDGDEGEGVVAGGESSAGASAASANVSGSSSGSSGSGSGSGSDTSPIEGTRKVSASSSGSASALRRKVLSSGVTVRKASRQASHGAGAKGSHGQRIASGSGGGSGSRGSGAREVLAEHGKRANTSPSASGGQGTLGASSASLAPMAHRSTSPSGPAPLAPPASASVGTSGKSTKTMSLGLGVPTKSRTSTSPTAAGTATGGGRKSSLTAMTAASAARAKEREREKEREQEGRRGVWRG